MRRYLGQEIGAGLKIGLVANDSLGNFVVSTPLAQMIRAKFPESTLTLFTGSRVRELAHGSPLFDEVVEIYGDDAMSVLRKNSAGGYAWIVNMERSPLAMISSALLAGEAGGVTGPCLSADGRGELPYEDTPQGRLLMDSDWMSPDVTARHSILKSGFIGEIFCRSAYLEGEVPAYSVLSANPGDVPDVLMATTASLPEKLWPVEKWVELIGSFRADGLSVGLLGAKPKDQAKFYRGANAEDEIVEKSGITDLRGELTLPEVVGALGRAKFVVTLDNGILHLAASTSTPTYGLFRNGIHRLWAPPAQNVKVIEPGIGGTVSGISVRKVIEEIKNFQISMTIF